MADINQILENYVTYLNLNTTLAESSKKKYHKIIRLFLMRTGMSFNIDSINKFISENNRGNKACYNYRFAFTPFLISIGKKNLVDSLVSVKRKPRKKQFKFVDKIKLGKMINALPKRFGKLAFMQVKTGGRFREIATIKAENIDFDLHDKLIYITVGEHAKGKKERKLRLSKKYESQIKKWIERPYGFVFLPNELSNISEEELSVYLDNMLRYYNNKLNEIGRVFLGIEDFSSHYLRHIFGDYFLKAGGDPVYLQKVLGHSKIETTMGYVSVADQIADNTLLRMEGEEI